MRALFPISSFCCMYDLDLASLSPVCVLSYMLYVAALIF